MHQNINYRKWCSEPIWCDFASWCASDEFEQMKTLDEQPEIADVDPYNIVLQRLIWRCLLNSLVLTQAGERTQMQRVKDWHLACFSTNGSNVYHVCNYDKDRCTAFE